MKNRSKQPEPKKFNREYFQRVHNGEIEGSRPTNDRRTGEKDRRKSSRRKEDGTEQKAPAPRQESGLQTFATVDKNRKGFAYLIPEGTWTQKDIYVGPKVAEQLFPGDRVRVKFRGRPPREIYSLQELDLVEHKIKKIFATALFLKHEPRLELHPEVRKHLSTPKFVGLPEGVKILGIVRWERRNSQEELPLFGLLRDVPDKVGDRTYVSSQLVFQESGKSGLEHPQFGRPVAVLNEVLGDEIPAAMDVERVAADYGLQEEHSESAIKDAEKAAATFHQLSDSELKQGREDLRHLPWITIDGERARDFDDAIAVEKIQVKGQTQFVLWVGIADVSYFVRPDTDIDDEAYRRATSVYFPERAFHMLPRALSEDVCSLRPNVPRFAMVVKRVWSAQGKVVSTDLMEGLIQSRRRATYLEIQAEYESAQKSGQIPKFPYRDHFELYAILRKLRQQRGSIDFELPEAEIACAPNGEPETIQRHPRLDTHRLIEEFMIAANEAVTEWMVMEKRLPFLFRIHEAPDPQKIAQFMEQAESAGAPFEAGAKKQHHRGRAAKAEQRLAPAPGEINSYLKSLTGHPAEPLLNSLLLRSMKQAIYSAKHEIHYGLASEHYTHFTSPIRRYPDLIVHRLIRAVLQGRAHEVRSQDSQQAVMVAADHCSKQERQASQVERDCIRIKQVRYMKRHVGEEFSGRVNGVADKGVFVQILEPFVEGMIPRDQLMGDIYIFDEDRLRMIGRRTRSEIKLGDPISVRVEAADLVARQVILAQPQAPKGRKPTQNENSHRRKESRPGRKKRR